MVVCQNDSQFQFGLSFYCLHVGVGSGPIRQRLIWQHADTDKNTGAKPLNIGTLSMFLSQSEARSKIQLISMLGALACGFAGLVSNQAWCNPTLFRVVFNLPMAQYESSYSRYFRNVSPL
jgi:hypothetical protein